MGWGLFWEDSKGRERNQSRRKLHIRRGLTSSINVRFTNGMMITPPPSLVNNDYALRYPYKNHTDIFSSFQVFFF